MKKPPKLISYGRQSIDQSDIDEVVKDGDRDFWMNSQEALDYGMIDEVLQADSKK